MLIGKEIETIFWDFDGVIKDSVKVKSDAYEQLFSPFGLNFSKKGMDLKPTLCLKKVNTRWKNETQ